MTARNALRTILFTKIGLFDYEPGIMHCCKLSRLLVQSSNLSNYCTIPDRGHRLINDKVIFFSKILGNKS